MSRPRRLSLGCWLNNTSNLAVVLVLAFIVGGILGCTIWFILESRFPIFRETPGLLTWLFSAVGLLVVTVIWNRIRERNARSFMSLFETKVHPYQYHLWKRWDDLVEDGLRQQALKIKRFSDAHPGVNLEDPPREFARKAELAKKAIQKFQQMYRAAEAVGRHTWHSPKDYYKVGGRR